MSTRPRQGTRYKQVALAPPEEEKEEARQPPVLYTDEILFQKEGSFLDEQLLNEEAMRSDNTGSEEMQFCGPSEDAIGKVFYIMMERERAQEKREQEWKEEERRRREEERLQEERHREEDRLRREEDNRHWEELFKTMISSTAKYSTSPTSSSYDRLRDIPKLPKLQDSDDIEAYLYTFERHMETYKVEKAYWVAQIAPLLRGMAQKAYMSVPREFSNNYEEVKETIFQCYD